MRLLQILMPAKFVIPSHRQLFSLFALLLFSFAVHAAPMPDGTMILTGSLAQSSDGKVIPSAGDVISVINTKTNQTETTAVYDGSGSYGIFITKPASFNNTQLTLRITHLGTAYKLNNAVGGESVFLFSGSFLPVTLTMNVVVESAGGKTPVAGEACTGAGGVSGSLYCNGAKWITPVAGSACTGTVTVGSFTCSGNIWVGSALPVGIIGGPCAGHSAPPNSTCSGNVWVATEPPPKPVMTGDVNSDSKVDETDVQLLKQAISGTAPLDKARMDVNGDAVVNTRDLIDLIRAVRSQSQSALNPASIQPVPVSIRSAPVSIRPVPALIRP